MTPEEHLTVPYELLSESVCNAEGKWVRRLSYPELPGVVAEADSVLDAYDDVEQQRVGYILDRVQRGESVHVPRPPLSSARLTRADRQRFGLVSGTGRS